MKKSTIRLIENKFKQDIAQIDVKIRNNKWEIKRLKNEVEKLKADLRGKDNEINDLKALVDYLRQFRPNKEEVTTQG